MSITFLPSDRTLRALDRYGEQACRDAFRLSTFTGKNCAEIAAATGLKKLSVPFAIAAGAEIARREEADRVAREARDALGYVVPCHYEAPGPDGADVSDPDFYQSITVKTSTVLRLHTGERFGLGAIPRGATGRQVHGGPLVPGPWAFAYQLGTVIDCYPERRAAEYAKDVVVADGFTLTIDRVTYVVRETSDGRYFPPRLTLEPVTDHAPAKPATVVGDRCAGQNGACQNPRESGDIYCVACRDKAERDAWRA